jgi:lysophospholipase L1-like esterase
MRNIGLGNIAAALSVVLAAFQTVRAAEPVRIPAVENLDRLSSWTRGVAAADAGQKALQIVCIGDSNTEGPAYVGELRRMLQGCYGERGIGYHSLGNRNPVPESPKIDRQGNWELLRDAPKAKAPLPPYFALDGIWAQTADPLAEVSVDFSFGSWPKSDNHLARDYNIQQRVRLHYQVGPDLGSFAICLGSNELRRVDCRAEMTGYAVTEALLCDGFRIAGIQGKVVLFGFDAERMFYQQGKPALRGGVLVHALGKSWGRTEEPAHVEDSAYAAFFGAIKPDLITILLGTNDQHNDGRVERYSEWLTTIVRKLQKHSPGSGILVIACPEAGQTKPGLAAKFRDAAREVAAVNGCAFWDLQSLVGPRSAQWCREGFFVDGLHYSPIGGGIMARLLLDRLGFNINDPRHYPALMRESVGDTARPSFAIRRIGAIPLDGVAGALSNEPPQRIWVNTAPAVDLRLAVAGDALALHAVVRDGQCAGPREKWTGGGLEVCIANPENVGRVMHNTGGPIVRQLFFSAVKPADGRDRALKQFTMDEANKTVQWDSPDSFPYSIAPIEPFGYEVKALIPLSQLVLKPDSREFLLEAAVTASTAPGGKPVYSRLFATKGDNGAFRDAGQSARVEISP